MFWNYFSVGMDAKAAYGFHSLREKRPWAASGRAMNQAWYGYYSLASGWFCAAPPLRNKATLQVWRCPAGGSPCLGGKRALGQCIWSPSLSNEHKLQTCPFLARLALPVLQLFLGSPQLRSRGHPAGAAPPQVRAWSGVHQAW